MLKPLVDSVFKLTLNRSEQANNTKELLDMCGLNASSQHCKPHFTNLSIRRFSVDKSNLLNLSSGIAIPSETTQEILAVPLKGKSHQEEHKQEHSKKKVFCKNYDMAWRQRKGHSSKQKHSSQTCAILQVVW